MYVDTAEQSPRVLGAGLLHLAVQKWEGPGTAADIRYDESQAVPLFGPAGGQVGCVAVSARLVRREDPSQQVL